LLHKSAEDQSFRFPGQTHSATFVTGMPSAVKPLSTDLELGDLVVEVPRNEALT
jgi:hypothetical protein